MLKTKYIYKNIYIKKMRHFEYLLIIFCLRQCNCQIFRTFMEARDRKNQKWDVSSVVCGYLFSYCRSATHRFLWKSLKSDRCIFFNKLLPEKKIKVEFYHLTNTNIFVRIFAYIYEEWQNILFSTKAMVKELIYEANYQNSARPRRP